MHSKKCIVFYQFAWVKCSHFNRNPRELEFEMRAKDFGFKLDMQICSVDNKTAWFESGFIVSGASCIPTLLAIDNGSFCL